MERTLHSTVAAAVLLLAPVGAAFVTAPASAQPYPYEAQARQGAIHGMTIDSDSGLQPGSTLRISVRATPGARWASLALADDVRVPLREREPGEYVGTHVIRRSDRIDPMRQMVLRAGWGQGPVAVAYDYPAQFRTQSMGNAPARLDAEVERFAMWPRADRLEPGRVVHFRVEGTPHARAGVRVPGVVDWLQLHEERPGTYVGSYTIRRDDDPDAFARARAVLRTRDQRVVARLDRGGSSR